MGSEVHVLTTGGTIASTSESGAARPTERGDELVEAVPELDEYADLRVEEVFQRGSINMDPEAVVTLGERAREVASDVDGVVVLHGTDTMEESAYYLDLGLDLDVPVVFTGAQRRPDEVSPDGPANMIAAVQAASSDLLAGHGGVYVAFNDEIHAARDVTKSHTSKLETFESPGKGPVAERTRSGLRPFRRPGSRTIDLPLQTTTARIEMIKSAIDVGKWPVEAAREAGVDGLVVEGTGIGNVSEELGRALVTALKNGLLVVITSRCHAGAVQPVYGTPGGGKTLHDAGAFLAGDLPAHKARVKLLLALEKTRNTTELRELFERTSD